MSQQNTPLVQIVGSPEFLPQYATDGSAGADLKACIEKSLSIAPGERRLVSTGIKMAIPHGWEGQVRPRSGLALKKGLTVLNSPGTIDSDYRGELGVVLVNLGAENAVIEPGERIAQLVISPVSSAQFAIVNSLSDSERGSGGFGSTGT